ncbi:MAG: signal peptidase I [Methanomicrobia archaeon]|nr:signal peptidase I [Methanomicrobia archaeon]
MQPFIEAILLTVAVSAFIAAIFFILYLVAVKGYESPLRLYNRFKRGYSEHSQKKRVEEKMTEYKSVSKGGRVPVLGSAIVLALFVIIVFALLFDVIFFVAITADGMQPTFKRGDLVLMQKISLTPAEGDIIMFERPNYMLSITHRVVAVTDSGVRTGGDARRRVDAWVVPEEEIMAKAMQVGGKPVVLKDVGDYFILETREMRYGKYGLEYTFVKNVFLTIKMYGYAVCIMAIIGYVILTLREAKKY